MESNQILIDIINQQSIKIQELENSLKHQHSNNNIKEDIFEVKQTNEMNINYKYICLVCNQLFTSEDIFNHSQQNKDHIDHCIHIDNIKNQLLNINNNNTSSDNNNIFKKRLETLWSSLKRLSTTHSLLNSKINEITNHFKIYYDFLMSKEHSLKKQIQDDIDTVYNDITHLFNEFKSIINIVNINNSLNIYRSENKDIDFSVSEDTSRKYSISSIIDSALIRYGDLERIKQYYNRNNINKLVYHHNRKSYQQIDIYESILEILKSNRIDILDYIIQDLHFDIKTQFKPNLPFFRPIHNIDLLVISTIYSNLETIKFIESIGIKNKIELKYDICLEVSPFSDNIEIFQYFSTKVIGMIDSLAIRNIHVSANAALLGQIDMIKWISRNTPFLFIYQKTNLKYCIDVATLNGHLETIKWLHQNRTEGCTTDAMDYAAKNGHLETIKWLHENRTEGCTTNAMNNAAENGHLETIKWLHENRTEGCTTNAMDYAAENGHLETIKWLHENRTEGCTTYAMDFAAHNGHLETIKWLHHNRTEGCKTDAMNFAAKNGNLETIKWLHENRSEGCTTEVMYWASNGQLETIKWYAMNSAASNGHLETIKWLHENRTEGCTTRAMNDAAKNGHLETIKWLHENRTEGCTTDAMDYAAENGHLEIVKWLQENRTEGRISNAIEI